jgi:peptidoglycan biosynthesis protein MviN/MurJ (putative lipid II flippase)
MCWPLVVISVIAHLTYNVLGAEIFYAKRTGWISVIFLTSATLNVGLTWLLLGALGIVAAGIGQAAGGLAGTGLAVWLTRRLFPLPLLEGRSVGVAAAACGVSVALPWLVHTRSLAGDLALHTVAFLALAGATLAAAGALRRLRELPSLLRRRVTKPPGREG